MQLFTKQCNTLNESQLSHHSALSRFHYTLPLDATRSQPEQIMIHKSADPPFDTSGYPSPLNTQFLLASSDYNTAAIGVSWFNSSRFFLLPFFRKIKHCQPSRHEPPPQLNDKCSTGTTRTTYTSPIHDCRVTYLLIPNRSGPSSYRLPTATHPTVLGHRMTYR